MTFTIATFNEIIRGSKGRVMQMVRETLSRRVRKHVAVFLVACLGLPLMLMVAGLEPTAAAQTTSFAAPVNFSIPAGGITAVAMADFNGDGLKDVAATSDGGDNVAVSLNTTTPGASTPTFGSPASFATGGDPTGVAVGDFNGDGLPDLVTANFLGNNVSVLLNTTAPGAATASFASAVNFNTGSTAVSVVVSDLNGDGRPDLVVANSGTVVISVLLNTTAPGSASPSFATHVDFTVGPNPESVAVGDFNGDGRPDIAAANSSVGTVSVLLNTTTPGAVTPTFAIHADFAVGAVPFGVSVGDFNGDGIPDLAVSNRDDNSVSVLLNTTAPGAVTPTFATHSDFGVGAGPRDVAVGDVSGDGRADIVVVNTNGTGISVLTNRTAPGAVTPTFGAASNIVTGVIPTFAAVGDLNGDGKNDIAVANFGSSNFSVSLNTTPMGVTLGFATAANFGAGTGPRSVAVGDFNGDGRQDVAVANFNLNNVSVLLNTTAPGAATPAIAAAVNFPAGTGPFSVAVCDFNGDGRPDLAVANSTSNNVSVLLNTTTPGAAIPTFATAANFTVGNNPHSIAVGDFNGDGRLDLAVTNFADNNASVLLNTTTPGAAIATFATAVNFATGTGPFSVAVGDFNGDGRPDLAVANNTSNNVSVLLNTTAPGAATAAFATAVNFAVGTGPFSVAVGDFNGDGRPDLAVANNTSNNVSVLLNTTAPGAATAAFATAVNFAAGTGPISVAAGDFNGDGRPDLAVANNASNNVSVLLSTTAPGAATPGYAATVNFTVGSGPSSVAFSDFNGDGRKDLAVANNVSNNVSILLNASAGPATNLAITQVNGGSNPTAGVPFSVVVQSQDNLGNPFNVVATTAVSISLTTGTGTLGGTVTGSITAGSNSTTISGVTYTKAESGVVLTATRTTGDTLVSGDSDPFTVNAGALNHFAIDNIATQDPGVPFNITITAQDSVNNTITGFTGTVNLSTTAGTISPTVSGAFAGGVRTESVTVTGSGPGKTISVDDGSGHTGTSNAFLVGCVPLTVLPASLPSTVVGSSYNNPLSASGGTGPYTFGITVGSAPTGLTLNSDGTWSGTTTTAGTFNFTVTATDGFNGCQGTRGYSVVVGSAVSSGNVLISEFRFRGPGGVNDEFVEFFNNSDSPITVGTSDGSTGWALVAADGATRFLIPNGTLIPGRGHFLGVNTGGYSLGGYAAGDQVLLPDGVTLAAGYAADIPDASGIALFKSGTALTLANRLDAAGYTGVNAFYREGTGFATGGAETFSNLQYSFYRNLLGGNPQDTDVNTADFVSVDSLGTATGQGSNLGAPGPENLASPMNRTGWTMLTPGFIDPCTAQTAAPNRVRFASNYVDGLSGTGAYSLGTLSIRRRYTNASASDSVTKLRYRIIDTTTFPAPNGGTADLRAISSPDVAVASTVCGGSSLTVRGTTLDQFAALPMGGGLNSVLSAGTITLGTPLSPGQSINVQFLLGVKQGGSFRFFVIVEALP